MVLDDFVYDPATQEGASSTSVVQGVFSFVSGQIAKNGPDSMVVNTPVAAIGIRGTTVAGRAAQTGQENTIALLQDADGGVGQITIANAAGSQVLSAIGQSVTLSSFTQPPPAPVVLPAAVIRQQFGSAVANRPVQRSQEEQRSRETNEGPREQAAPSEEAVPDDATGEQEGQGADGEIGPDGEPLPEGEIGPDGEPLPEGEIGPDGEPLPGGEIGPDGEPVPEGGIGPDGEPLPEGELGPEGEPGPGEGPGSEGELGPDGRIPFRGWAGSPRVSQAQEVSRL